MKKNNQIICYSFALSLALLLFALSLLVVFDVLWLSEVTYSPVRMTVVEKHYEIGKNVYSITVVGGEGDVVKLNVGYDMFMDIEKWDRIEVLREDVKTRFLGNKTTWVVLARSSASR